MFSGSVSHLCLAGGGGHSIQGSGGLGCLNGFNIGAIRTRIGFGGGYHTINKRRSPP